LSIITIAILYHQVPNLSITIRNFSVAGQVEHNYTGPLDDEVAPSMMRCDAAGPLVANVVKMYPKSDCTGFDAFARVLSGTLKVRF
jgi:translation elongation factor EF-G